jgi:hypothetical protein
MTVEGLNSIGSVGVILSVFFLAYQIYQIKKNTTVVKANYSDSLNTTNIEFLRQLIENKELGKLFEKATTGWAGLNEEDKRTSNYLFIKLFRHWENMYCQNKVSVLDIRLWSSHLNTMTGYFHHTGTQEWWIHHRMAFAKDFRDLLESTERPKKIYPTVKDLNNQISTKELLPVATPYKVMPGLRLNQRLVQSVTNDIHSENPRA